MNIFDLLGIVAIVAIVLSFFIGKNAIWGGLTLGAIIGVLVGIIRLLIGYNFGWDLFKKIVIVSVILGTLFEIIGRLASTRKRA